MITGLPPFAHKIMDGAVILSVVQGVRPERPRAPSAYCSDELWHLITRCWAQKPWSRPRSAEVLHELHSLPPKPTQLQTGSQLKLLNDMSKAHSDRVLKPKQLEGVESPVEILMKRVQNWKGINVEDFGSLKIHDVVMVSEGHWCRTFYVYVFEKVVLFLRKQSLHRRAPLTLQSKVFTSAIREVGSLLPSCEYSSHSIVNAQVKYFNPVS
jgi:hypothetical protein